MNCSFIFIKTFHHLHNFCVCTHPSFIFFPILKSSYLRQGSDYQKLILPTDWINRFYGCPKHWLRTGTIIFARLHANHITRSNNSVCLYGARVTCLSDVSGKGCVYSLSVTEYISYSHRVILIKLCSFVLHAWFLDTMATAELAIRYQLQMYITLTRMKISILAATVSINRGNCDSLKRTVSDELISKLHYSLLYDYPNSFLRNKSRNRNNL